MHSPLYYVIELIIAVVALTRGIYGIVTGVRDRRAAKRDAEDQARWTAERDARNASGHATSIPVNLTKQSTESGA